MFFPPACVACGEVVRGGFFCGECAGLVETIPDQGCRVCHEPGGFTRCPRCAARLPVFTEAYAPFAHEGSVARAVRRFKYEDQPSLARPLAELLVSQGRGWLKTAPAMWAAIPLHAERYQERGYDQATLLAVALAKKCGARLIDGLFRERETSQQVRLSEDERRANVDGAFVAMPMVRGEKLLLIDDVYTTGATANAAARAALEAGAVEVKILTLARAVRESY